MKFQKGQNVFVIVSGVRVTPAIIKQQKGGFCIVQLEHRTGGIRLRESKIFITEEEAYKNLKRIPDEPTRIIDDMYHSRFDYN